jgi:hypothetical protein
MPPTIKDSSSTLSTSPEKPERSAETSPAPEEISSAQPVALEVPVTVNGTRAVEGSDKRETFSEKTNTVLVLANGAVIRLSSSVAPGQLLFLTNEKTRKEIVSQAIAMGRRPVGLWSPSENRTPLLPGRRFRRRV